MKFSDLRFRRVSEGCTESQIIRKLQPRKDSHTDAIVFRPDTGGFVFSGMEGQKAVRCADSFELSALIEEYHTAPDDVQAPGFRTADPISEHLN